MESEVEGTAKVDKVMVYDTEILNEKKQYKRIAQLKFLNTGSEKSNLNFP